MLRQLAAPPAAVRPEAICQKRLSAALFGARLNTLGQEQKLHHAHEHYRMDVAAAALDLAASSATRHEIKARRPNNEGETNV